MRAGQRAVTGTPCIWGSASSPSLATGIYNSCLWIQSFLARLRWIRHGFLPFL